MQRFFSSRPLNNQQTNFGFVNYLLPQARIEIVSAQSLPITLSKAMEVNAQAVVFWDDFLKLKKGVAAEDLATVNLKTPAKKERTEVLPETKAGKKILHGVPDVSSPGHFLAGARAARDYHYSYHMHHAGESRDSSNSPEEREGHARLANAHLNAFHQADAHIKRAEQSGIKDNSQHHRDLAEYHRVAPESQPETSRTPASYSMRGVHSRLAVELGEKEKQKIRTQKNTEEIPMQAIAKSFEIINQLIAL
jgi:hypothetical protein